MYPFTHKYKSSYNKRGITINEFTFETHSSAIRPLWIYTSDELCRWCPSGSADRGLPRQPKHRKHPQYDMGSVTRHSDGLQPKAVC